MGELASHFAEAPDSQTWELGAAFFADGRSMTGANSCGDDRGDDRGSERD